jgi:uridine phosphorylase
MHMKPPPLLDHDHAEPTFFRPENLLEGARRQKGLPPGATPAGCLLDIDGDLLEHLLHTGGATVDRTWPCFHTKLHRWTETGFGIVAGTVGAPYAVLVAEELFASGCEAVVSISSAGIVTRDATPPFFALIESALRDEGTSHHYASAARYAVADPALMRSVASALETKGTRLLRGTSWTTDAPFRETRSLIDSRQAEGIVCVEMEAAGLLAMAGAQRRPVVCLAHVTNAMATRPGDFEKGGRDGQEEALEVCSRALAAALGHVRAEPAARGGEVP